MDLAKASPDTVDGNEKIMEALWMANDLIVNSTNIGMSNKLLKNLNQELIYNFYSVLDMILYYIRAICTNFFQLFSILGQYVMRISRQLWQAVFQWLREVNLVGVIETLGAIKATTLSVFPSLLGTEFGMQVCALSKSIIATISNHEFQRWAASLTLVLAFVAWFWGLSTGAILSRIFRRPLNSMGIEYRSMSFSPIRLSITMTDIVAYPSSCSILRTILLCLLPSSDVSTPPPEGKPQGENPIPEATASPSYIRIELLSVRPSLTLWWARPLRLLFPHKSERLANEEQEGDKEKPKKRDLINLIVKYVAVCCPAPMLNIECHRVRIEVDKSYLGCMVPDFDGDHSAIPGSVRASLIAEQQNLRLPTFYNQSTPRLDSFRADAATFNLERWLEQCHKIRDKLKQIEHKHAKKVRPRQSSEQNEDWIARDHLDESTYDDHQNKNMPTQLTQEEMSQQGSPNALLQATLRVLLTAFHFTAYEFEYIVRAAGVESVKGIRKNYPPDQAALQLAIMNRMERAATVLGLKQFTLSFHGYSSDLVMASSGFYIRVGSPPVQRRTKNHPWSKSTDHGVPHFDFQKRINGHHKLWKVHEEEPFRTWTNVVSPCDCLIHVSGVLDLCVWLFGYDHYWYQKSLNLSFSIVDQTFSLDPDPLHTVLIHFDDWIDAMAPINEWRTWFVAQLKSNPPLQEELVLYRQCYEFSRLDKKHIGVGNSHSNNQINNSMLGDLCPDEYIAKIEQRMRFDQIMDERRHVMGINWEIPDFSELKDFIKASGREPKPLETGVGADVNASFFSTLSGSQDRKCSQPFLYESLLALVEIKSSIMACRISVSILLPTWKVLVTDEASLSNKKSRFIPTEVIMHGCKTKYFSKSRLLPYDASSTLLADNGAQIPDEAYMLLHLSAETAVWGPKTDRVPPKNLDIPRFVSTDAYCGLLYEVSVFFCELLIGNCIYLMDKIAFLIQSPIRKERLTFSLDLIFSNMKDSVVANTDIRIHAGDMIFIIVPSLLAQCHRILPKVSALPYRYVSEEPTYHDSVSVTLSSPKGSHDIEFINSRDTLDSELSDADGFLSENLASTESNHNLETKPIEDIQSPYEGSILRGSNMSISLSIFNISQVFLLSDTDLDQGSLELYVRRINCALVSDADQERFELDLGESSEKPFRLTSCRVYSRKSMGISGKGIYVHTLPLKEAFVLDTFETFYERSIVSTYDLENDKRSRSNRPHFPQDDLKLLPSQKSVTSHDVTIKIALEVGKFVLNITPTFTAVINGVAQVSSLGSKTSYSSE